jgi:hypothetical protein
MIMQVMLDISKRVTHTKSRYAEKSAQRLRVIAYFSFLSWRLGLFPALPYPPDKR